MINKIHLNATKIDLSHQDLTEIPRDIYECRNLRKLNLSHNKLKKIPVELSRLKLLTNLSLSHNEITTLYAKNFSFPKLKVLVLNNNKIRSLPKQIANLTNLQSLFLAQNKLADFPEELSKLSKLRSLSIAFNAFQKFPKSILSLQMLEELWLNGNKFESFPYGSIISDLSKLDKLYCFGAELGDTPILKQISFDRGNCFWRLKIATSLDNQQKSSQNIMSNPIDAINTDIFISYSHADVEWLERINVALRTLHYEGLSIDAWNDNRIKPGDEWKNEIDKAISKASIVIMLVSMDFLASRFIRENEIPPFLEKAHKNGTIILPVIIGRCRFTTSPIGKYQAVNNPSQPLNAMSKAEVENVLYNLTETIVQRIK